MLRPHVQSTLFPYTTLFRSCPHILHIAVRESRTVGRCAAHFPMHSHSQQCLSALSHQSVSRDRFQTDRKSTRLNSSHVSISYAVFCLKKKKKDEHRKPIDIV